MTTEEYDENSQSPGLLILIAILTALALAVGATLLPHDRYIRYQQMADTIHFRSIWGYERIVFDKTPIDVAVIGNSRLGAGVSAPVLEAALSRHYGRTIHVANLSLAQDGADLHYSITKLLLAYHPEVKLVLLVAIEQTPRGSHPAFRNLADVSDVVTSPLLLNRDYFDNLTFLPFRQLSLAAQTAFPGLFSVHRDFDPAKYAGSDLDTTTSFREHDGTLVNRDRIPSEAEIAPTAYRRRTEITAPKLPAWAGEFAVPHTFIRRAAQAVRRNGADVAFVYLPIFNDHAGIRDADFYANLGPILRASFLADDHRNYADYVHLNHVVGVPRVNQWLASEIEGKGLLPQTR